MARDTFSAELWLWTLCPASLPRPLLDTLTLPTAASLTRAPLETTALDDGRIYASQFVQGLFRYNWAMGAYPFDSQTVVIPIDESFFGAENLLLEPDTAGSFLSRNVRAALTGWRVSDLTLTTSVVAAESTYGVPGAASDRFARAEAAFTLDRTSLVPFLKLTSGVLAAAFIAFFSFFYDPHEKSAFGGKIGLLVGVLFAVLVNMRAADSTLGDSEDMTLVTQIHLVTLAFIVVLALLALHDRLRVDDGATLPHPHWRRLSFFGLGYIGLTLLLIVRAILA